VLARWIAAAVADGRLRGAALQPASAHDRPYRCGRCRMDSPAQAASLLAQAGVGRVRGFALNATQYGSPALELDFGAKIVSALGAEGIRRKHFVINTAQNGAPFLAGQYPGNSNFPRVCTSRSDHICETLGIPPTWHTAARQWGCPPRTARSPRMTPTRICGLAGPGSITAQLRQTRVRPEPTGDRQIRTRVHT
jgi:hypothetical protein